MNTASFSRGITALALALCSALALWFGFEALVEWTFRGLSPGARHLGDTWPLGFWIVLGVGVVGAGLRFVKAPGDDVGASRLVEGLGALALVTIGWALCMSSASVLPAFASGLDLGAGPFLRPVYLALAVVSVGLVVGPWRVGLAERALLLFVLWSTCNGKLFGYDLVPGFGLLQLGGLATIAILGSGEAWGGLVARARARIGTAGLAVAGALLVWWLIAALDAGRSSALQLVWRMWAAALVALVAIGVPWKDPRATGNRVFGTLIAGLVIVLVCAALGVAEAAGIESWSTALASRLRVLGLHPNLGAALFAAGLPLALGLVLPRAPTGRLVRSIGLVVALGAAAVLVLSGSRASMLGAAAGLAAFGVLAFTPLLSRIGVRTFIGSLALAGLAVALLLSPLGEGVRASLDAKTHTQSALGQRWHIWSMSAAAAQDHPLFGLGPAGFAGHAQYAQSSYYDGTSQVLHTHNLFLAALEGAGWIGLGLFAAFLVVLFETLRKGALAIGRRGVALLAAVFGLLVCNQLDLGQSQMSFLPLFFWMALLCGALWRELPAAREPAPPPKPRFASPGLLTLLLLWPSTGAVLAGEIQLMKSGRLFSRNQDAEAVQILLDLLSPLYLVNENGIGVRLTQWARREGRGPEELAFAELTLEYDDQTPGVKRRYAQALVHWGHFARGVEQARAALAADPYGEDANTMRVLVAWGELGRGERDEGIRRLAAALVDGARLPKDLMQEFGDEPFRVAMMSELKALGAEIVEQAHTDEVAARRRLAGLTGAFREFGAPVESLPYFEGVVAASKRPIRSTYYQWIVLLRELGEEDEALRIWKASPFAEEVNFQAIFAGLEDPAEVASAAAASGDVFDLFFSAGQLVQRYMARARELASEGDAAGARVALRRALYNAKDEAMRVNLVTEFMHYGLESKAERVWQVRRYLERASVTRKRSRDFASMARVLDWCVPPFESPAAVIEAVGSSAEGIGPLGAIVRQVLEL